MIREGVKYFLIISLVLKGSIVASAYADSASGWSDVTPAEYAAFGALAIGDGVAAFAIPAPNKPKWTATNAFDDAFRNKLRLSSQSARTGVNNASTALVGALAAWPVLADAVGVTIIGKKETKEGLQLLAVDAESYTALLAALFATKNTVARERPYNRNCPNADCSNADRYESFFSGHTSLAFNSAGLICSEHLNARLYGSATADGAVCAAALATATAVGAMRIMADQHYASDVLAGAALGSLSGFLIPQLHFGFGKPGAIETDRRDERAATVSIAPVFTPVQQGIAASLVW